DGFSGEALYPGPRDPGYGRARLPGGPGLGACRQAQSDGRHAAFDDQEVSCHLTKPPVVVRALGEVGVRRAGDPGEEAVALPGGPAGQEPDRLPEPFGAVWRVVDDPKSHRRIMRP